MYNEEAASIAQGILEQQNAKTQYSVLYADRLNVPQREVEIIASTSQWGASSFGYIIEVDGVPFYVNGWSNPRAGTRRLQVRRIVE